MSDLTEAQQQAQAALEKVMNCRFSNFDAGAVIHWAERGFYQVKAEAASRISQQDAELERMRREVEEAKRQIDFGIHQSDLERATIVARRDAFSEAEEVVRHLCSNNEEAVAAIRAKAEGRS